MINAWGRPNRHGTGAEGARRGHERLAPALRRGHLPARALGRAIRRDDYRAEALTYAMSLIPHLLRQRPDVVFFSDWPLAPVLGRVRQASGLRYKLLLSNGAPGPPPYHPAIDHVQQLTPNLMRIALEGGEDPRRHTMVPLGVPVDARFVPVSADERAGLRRRLGLPLDRRVVLSVAALNDFSKRLRYLVAEIASLPRDERPFLALVGHREEETPLVLAAADEQLGQDGYSVHTARPEEVRDWYRAADVFTLTSTTEGFGLVLLEAMAQGLPCIAHDYVTTQFVLGEEGYLADIRVAGGWVSALRRLDDAALAPDAAARRHAWVRDNFGWNALRPRYVEMIERVAATA